MFHKSVLAGQGLTNNFDAIPHFLRRQSRKGSRSKVQGFSLLLEPCFSPSDTNICAKNTVAENKDSIVLMDRNISHWCLIPE